MNTPRKHHYLPKSYLAAWTDSGTIDGQVHVIDKSTGNAWAVRPVNAAKETDLYMIDVSKVVGDIEATEIESFFGKIEDAAAPVIKRMISGDPMPDTADRESLMTFLAVLTLRVPARLRWIDELLRKPIETVYRRLEAEGKLSQPEDPDLASKMKEWFDQGLIRIEIKQNARLDMMMAGVPTLAQLLTLRRWTVLRAQKNAGDLVCTDHPVLLEWIKRAAEGASPGFGLENTAVFVPLGPSTALLGLWNAEPKNATLTENQVTFWNGELLGLVDRFVFSRGDFAALHKTDAIDRRADVIRRWAKS